MPSLGDWGGWATGPYWTPTTLSHATKTENHSALPNTYKHREAAKMRRQRTMAQMKEQNKSPEKELNKDKQSFTCRVQNTAYKDCSRNSLVILPA